MKKLFFTITLLSAPATYCPPKINPQPKPTCFFEPSPTGPRLGYQIWSAKCGKSPYANCSPNPLCIPAIQAKPGLYNTACIVGQLPCLAIKK